MKIKIKNQEVVLIPESDEDIFDLGKFSSKLVNHRTHWIRNKKDSDKLNKMEKLTLGIDELINYIFKKGA